MVHRTIWKFRIVAGPDRSSFMRRLFFRSFSHRWITDDLYDPLFYTFLEMGIVDLPDGFLKVRMTGNGHHEDNSSMNLPSSILVNVPFLNSSNAFSVFSANRISSRNAGSGSPAFLPMILSRIFYSCTLGSYSIKLRV